MQTIIVDLFHPDPEELSQKAALHDIIGTSESSVNFALVYNNNFRFYYCDDVAQEISALEWNAHSMISLKNKITLLDVRDTNTFPENITQIQDEIRLIINGQGFIGGSDLDEDMIAGLDTNDFIATLETILEVLKINTNTRRISELVIFSCRMARSDAFTKALCKKFENTNEIKIVLFKEIISFSSSGTFISFFDDGQVKNQHLNELLDDTASTIYTGTISNLKNKIQQTPNKSLLDMNVTLQATIKETLAHGLRSKRIYKNVLGLLLGNVL